MDNLGFVEQAIKRLKHLKHLSSFPLFDVRLKVRHSKICPAPATATDGCEITWQARTGGQQQTDVRSQGRHSFTHPSSNMEGARPLVPGHMLTHLIITTSLRTIRRI
jgi:hypothetical protein